VYSLGLLSKDLSYPGHVFSASDAPEPSVIESPTVMTNNGGGGGGTVIEFCPFCPVDKPRTGRPRLNPLF
jgi:hypothetical protein